MSTQQLFISLFLTIFCLTGCASFENHQQSSLTNQQLELKESPDVGTDIRDYSNFNPRTNHKKLNDYVQQMIIDFQLNGPFSNPIAITSFVEFDETLNKTNSLGNQLAEAFLIEMSQAGYPVADINASGKILINADGSFAFTRQQQKQFSKLCCALSGNLIYQSDGVRVNSKVFDIKTKRIFAASSLVIPYFVVEHLGQTQTP
ncbi:MAG: TolB-like protein [Paraglaciecola sp.]|jgi:TolB-like protein